MTGKCRDASEDVAEDAAEDVEKGVEEERPYSEDPSDWPASHLICDTLRQRMTERMSHTLDQKRATGAFLRPIVIVYC